jgi:uncharacterized protein DUF4115
VTVTATTGGCWVEVRTLANGATVLARVVPAGQQASMPLTGAATVQLGAPGEVSVALDHLAVVLPSGYQAPFELTFQPSGSP